MISIFIASFYVKATETKNKIKQSPVGLGGCFWSSCGKAAAAVAVAGCRCCWALSSDRGGEEKSAELQRLCSFSLRASNQTAAPTSAHIGNTEQETGSWRDTDR